MSRRGAIQKGLAYLQTAQASNGSFVSYSSPSHTDFATSITYHTTFVPAVMLGALGKIPDALAVRSKLAHWLTQQRSTDWSFNYWAIDSPERGSLPYPDDLDDTACALIGLYLHDKTLIDGAVLGKAVKLLLFTETQVGGPYRTWLVPPDSPKEWLDVDVAVNSNIAYFLRLAASSLPHLTALMERSITCHDFTSPYYPSEYPLLYYIARAYNGPQRTLLRDYIVQKAQDGHWGSPLNTALALSALHFLDDTTEHTVALTYLLRTQKNDGSWPAEAFCIDPAKQGTQHYHGSTALTTALVLEALQPTAAVVQLQPTKQQNNQLYKRIIASVKKDLSRFEPELAEQAAHTLSRVEQFDNRRDIVLLPQLFAASLAEPKQLPNQLFIHLGRANLYGWMAYTIYDDFLDNEGNPRQLSVANAALRRSIAEFAWALPKHAGFQALVQQTFDAIDNANAWELANARFLVTKNRISWQHLPDYSNAKRLADRSLGHTLTPLGILAHIGQAPEGNRARKVQSALRHYITARQLSDDAHDWQDDLRTGQGSYVVCHILKDLKITPGAHNLATLLPAMQRQFWHHTLTTICADISEQTLLARQAAKDSGLLAPVNFISVLCDKIDATTQITLAEQTKTKDFLAAYRSKNT